MDYCELCFDRPQPLECRGLGKVRLDAVEGGRRLLGELEIRGPVRLHFVEVEAHRRTWFSGDRALYAVTVYNRSSLPMDRVVVSGGTSAFLEGSVRINGLSQPMEEPGEEQRDSAPSPEEETLRREEGQRLRRLLHGLEEPYREVFLWRHYGGLGFREVGQLFGKSENWACVTYHRARGKLRKEWEAST